MKKVPFSKIHRVLLPHMETPSTTPGLKPPEGVTPAFHTAGPLQDVNIIAIVLCLAISTLLLVVQLWTKLFAMNGLQGEDCEFGYKGKRLLS